MRTIRSRVFPVLLAVAIGIPVLPGGRLAAQTHVLPTPVPPDAPHPTGSSGLQDYASKIRNVPREKRPGGALSAKADPRLAISRMDVEAKADGVEVSGYVRNLTAQRVWLRVVLEGRTFDGAKKQTALGSTQGDPLDPGEQIRFSGHLSGCLRDSVVAYVVSIKELGGSIESWEERGLADCLAFEAIFPEDRSLPGRSLEVRAKNRCTSAVPPERTWFRIVVRNAIKDLFTTRTDQFREAIPAGAEVRREVTINLPANAIVTISAYRPES